MANIVFVVEHSNNLCQGRRKLDAAQKAAKIFDQEV